MTLMRRPTEEDLLRIKPTIRSTKKTDRDFTKFKTFDKYPVETVLKYKDKLPKQFYVVAMLRAAGHAQGKIAVHLDTPQGTVKSRIHRAFALIDKFESESNKIEADY